MRPIQTALAVILASAMPAAAQQATPQAQPSNTGTAGQGTDPSLVRVGEVIRLSDWDTDALYQDGWSAEALFGREVYSRDGEEIGDVEDLIVGSDGRLLALVAEVGGIWDIGDTHVSVPWKQVTFRQDGTVAVPVTEDNADEFSVLNEPGSQQLSQGIVSGLDDQALGARAWRASELIGDIARIRANPGTAQGGSQTGEQAGSDASTVQGGTNRQQPERSADAGQAMPAGRNDAASAGQARTMAYRGYGYVNDLIFEGGRVVAAVVDRDSAYGTRGRYAYPFYGYGYGWAPGNRYYDLPYNREEAVTIAPFDYERLNES